MATVMELIGLSPMGSTRAGDGGAKKIDVAFTLRQIVMDLLRARSETADDRHAQGV